MNSSLQPQQLRFMATLLRLWCCFKSDQVMRRSHAKFSRRDRSRIRVISDN